MNDTPFCGPTSLKKNTGVFVKSGGPLGINDLALLTHATGGFANLPGGREGEEFFRQPNLEIFKFFVSVGCYNVNCPYLKVKESVAMAKGRIVGEAKAKRLVERSIHESPIILEWANPKVRIVDRPSEGGVSKLRYK